MLHSRAHKHLHRPQGPILTGTAFSKQCLSFSLNCIFKSHWVSKHSSICEILTTSAYSCKSFGLHLSERQSLKKKIVILIYLPIQAHISIIFKQATWYKTSVMNICSSEPLLKFSSDILGAGRPLEKSWHLIWHLNCQHLLQRKPRASTWVKSFTEHCALLPNVTSKHFKQGASWN